MSRQSYTPKSGDKQSTVSDSASVKQNPMQNEVSAQRLFSGNPGAAQSTNILQKMSSRQAQTLFMQRARITGNRQASLSRGLAGAGSRAKAGNSSPLAQLNRLGDAEVGRENVAQGTPPLKVGVQSSNRRIARSKDEKPEDREKAFGQKVGEVDLGGSTTESYYNLRSAPAIYPRTIIGKLKGQPLKVKVVDKSISDGHVWYLLQFKSSADYASVVMVPKNADKTTQAFCGKYQAWASKDGVATHISYASFMKQLQNFEKIHAQVPLKERITKLRQMAHPAKLPFDTVIGTSGGDYYENDRPELAKFYQLLKDAKAIKTPSGEIIDIYHFIVGMDAYQKDRIHKYRVKFVKLGYSDPSATWAGDIGAGAGDMLLKTDKTYEKNNPTMNENDKINHYYRTRAPDADLLADVDAWATMDRVEQSKSGESIHSLIESVYGAGNATEKQAPKSRKKALQLFITRHALKTDGNSLVNAYNREIIKFYIADFGRIWIYNRQLPKSFWIGSSYDKSKLQDISDKMADKFLKWLDKQAQSNEVYSK